VTVFAVSSADQRDVGSFYSGPGWILRRTSETPAPVRASIHLSYEKQTSMKSLDAPGLDFARPKNAAPRLTAYSVHDLPTKKWAAAQSIKPFGLV
jgi:hypothetical protein